MAAVLLALTAYAERVGDFDEAFRHIHRATVVLDGGRCAGVLVGDGRQVMTTAHCLGPAEQTLEVWIHDGRRDMASVLFVDRQRDVAFLELSGPAPAEPLRISDRPPRVGDRLLFAGRSDRAVMQIAELERLGKCPSLPGVDEALFTTLRGVRGDSGAPVVDLSMEIVGLVHGGAQCSIATPTHGLASVVNELSTGVGGAFE